MADSSINAWVSSITTHLQRWDSSTVTVHKVPERLRRGEKDAYEPRIISFGPYHHGKPSLEAMEKYKWSFLEAILASRPEIPLERYIKEIKEEEAKIRTCYTDDFNIDSEEFVEMMLIDGCFLVGYFLELNVTIEPKLDSIAGIHELIKYDILLLENQLPFFILSKIFELLQSSFMDHAIQYVNWAAGKTEVNFRPREPVHHLLHLYHSLCLYPPPIHGKQSGPRHQPHSDPEKVPLISQTHGEESDSHSSTVHHEAGEHRPHSATVPHKAEEHQPPSVTSLHRAGVKFEKKGKGSSISLDVEFDIIKGKMMIPPLVIDSFYMSTLRNLVAFEQLYPNFNELDKSFTAYVEFMDFIVNTPEDVALLRKQGIIRHFLGSDKKAANFFNDLNQGVFVKKEHYLASLYEGVDYYQKNRCHTWWAQLMHNYCNSPWAILGIVVGGILLVLAVVQTILSVYSAF